MLRFSNIGEKIFPLNEFNFCYFASISYGHRYGSDKRNNAGMCIFGKMIASQDKNQKIIPSVNDMKLESV